MNQDGRSDYLRLHGVVDAFKDNSNIQHVYLSAHQSICLYCMDYEPWRLLVRVVSLSLSLSLTHTHS